MPGVSHRIIHDHEEAAESAFVLSLISGAVALGFIVVNRWKPGLNMLFKVCVILACSASLLLLINASHKGGMIRHPELTDVNSDREPQSGFETDEHEEKEVHSSSTD